jgi:N-acetylglucosamine repressor
MQWKNVRINLERGKGNAMAIKGDNMISVKQSNRAAILNLLHEKKGMSRKRIAEELGLTPSAITLIITDMIKEGLLKEGETLPGEGSAGRKEVIVEIVTKNFIALGITINLNEIILSAIHLNGAIIFQNNLPNDNKMQTDKLVAHLSRELKKLVKKYELDPDRIVGLGVAIRGIVDLERKTSINSFGALKEDNVPLYQMFEKETGLPITLENNVRSLCEAHIFLLQKERPSSMLFLRAEVGIGGAVVINSKVHYGGNGKCSELGHVPVVKNGRLCKCGKRGCLETIASRESIERSTKSIFSLEKTPQLYKIADGNIEHIDYDMIVEAAMNGDKNVEKILRNAIVHLADTLKAVVYAIDPQIIVLYGKMFENKYYFDWLSNEMKIGTEDCHGSMIKVSEFNMTLENKCSGILAVRSFYGKGGLR